jgi:hypothetical protein
MPKFTEEDWKSDRSSGIALVLAILTIAILTAVVILSSIAGNATILILAGVPILAIAANGGLIFSPAGEPDSAIGYAFRFPGAWMHYWRRVNSHV